LLIRGSNPSLRCGAPTTPSIPGFRWCRRRCRAPFLSRRTWCRQQRSFYGLVSASVRPVCFCLSCTVLALVSLLFYLMLTLTQTIHIIHDYMPCSCIPILFFFKTSSDNVKKTMELHSFRLFQDSGWLQAVAKLFQGPDSTRSRQFSDLSRQDLFPAVATIILGPDSVCKENCIQSHQDDLFLAVTVLAQGPCMLLLPASKSQPRPAMPCLADPSLTPAQSVQLVRNLAARAVQ